MDGSDAHRAGRRHADRRPVGSTSGAIKLVRHIVIAKMLRARSTRCCTPGSWAAAGAGAVVDERALRAVIVFVFLYLGVCAAGAVAILFDSELQGVPLTAFEAMPTPPRCWAAPAPGSGSRGRWARSSRSATNPPGADGDDVPGTARDHPRARPVHRQPLACVRASACAAPSRTDTAGRRPGRRR